LTRYWSKDGVSARVITLLATAKTSADTTKANDLVKDCITGSSPAETDTSLL
jgi:hypothetical protein